MDPADYPPELPEWLDEVWQLFERISTQVITAGFSVAGVNYEPAIEIVKSKGAIERLDEILEYLQVIEREITRKPKTT